MLDQRSWILGWVGGICVVFPTHNGVTKLIRIWLRFPVVPATHSLQIYAHAVCLKILADLFLVNSQAPVGYNTANICGHLAFTGANRDLEIV